MKTTAAINDKVAGIMVPNLVLFNSPVWLLQKPNGFCKIIGYFHKPKQIVVSITSIFLDILSLLEQINITSGTWCVAIDLGNVYFSITIIKGDQED